MEFSQWLQQEMDKRQLTNYRLAKLSGVHQSTIANLLGGKNPQIETERKIREAILKIDQQKEAPTPVSESGPARNIIKIAGRDGSFVERELTDEQVALMKNMLDQMKPIDDESI
ncbi:MAG: hypothetical protein SO072_13545 [Dysosmobacter sp.]|nr:hypothetical protein [Dysosmobacter sp.]